MVANVKTAPVPPVPQYKNVLDAQGRFVSLEWLQWFVSVRDKINVINELLVNLGLFTGGVPNIGPGGTVSAATTDDVPEGAVNKYFTETRVLETLLDGLTISPDAPIVDTDNVLEAFGKLQAQIDSLGGSGGLSFIGTFEVSGSPATTISITGLDLATDNEYCLRGSVKNDTGSPANISFFCEADTTATNYYTQTDTADGATASASRSNNAIIFVLPANECATFTFELKLDLEGKARALVSINIDSPTAIKHIDASYIYNVVSNVTSIDITSSVASALDVGSKVNLYKYNV